MKEIIAEYATTILSVLGAVGTLTVMGNILGPHSLLTAGILAYLQGGHL